MDEDEDADEVEFSDDESEAAWRRQQRAAEPPKRRMPQSGPAYVLPTGAPAAHALSLVLLCLAGAKSEDPISLRIGVSMAFVDGDLSQQRLCRPSYELLWH